MREIRDGITTSVRFNAVVETGVPGLYSAGAELDSVARGRMSRFDVCLWHLTDPAHHPVYGIKPRAI
jgi:hypothetical protein